MKITIDIPDEKIKEMLKLRWLSQAMGKHHWSPEDPTKWLAESILIELRKSVIDGEYIEDVKGRLREEMENDKSNVIDRLSDIKSTSAAKDD